MAVRPSEQADSSVQQRVIQRVYLASPLGFSPSGRLFMTHVIDALRRQDVTVLNPWDVSSDQVRLWQDSHGLRGANDLIGQHNAELIQSADAVFAILDGVDVDSGTASEIGYAYAHGKLVIGYRGDFRLAGDNAAARVNLQVEYFIRASGGAVFAALDYADHAEPGEEALRCAVACLVAGGRK